VAGETDVLASGDEPFRRVILIPSECIPIVHRKLVMEIMISLAHGQKSRDQMIARRMLVIVRCVTKPVGYGVDAKRRLDEPFNKSCCIKKINTSYVMTTCHAECSDKTYAPIPVAPQYARDDRR
jgi:hypothetical protein